MFWMYWADLICIAKPYTYYCAEKKVFHMNFGIKFNMAHGFMHPQIKCFSFILTSNKTLFEPEWFLFTSVMSLSQYRTTSL